MNECVQGRKRFRRKVVLSTSEFQRRKEERTSLVWKKVFTTVEGICEEMNDYYSGF